ncbi:MAG: hypothetical protein KDA69_17580 [Planctomycetaceae bacterium]|nr:hypothetical protein [Planctomycetaceae bacterium]MCA9046144.1 hypothetical protein [Planctomycetaceae bacterium]MCB9949886.1 hypothetical protein [Planctomycetaceae bacterium]
MGIRLYRLCVVILLAIFVCGSLYFGFLISQNGRYMQYDHGAEYSPDGKRQHLEPKYYFDTRTGRIRSH